MNRPDLDAIEEYAQRMKSIDKLGENLLRGSGIQNVIDYARELEDNLHTSRHQTPLERIAELIEIENHLTGTSFAAYEQIQELRKRIRELEAGDNV